MIIKSQEASAGSHLNIRDGKPRSPGEGKDLPKHMQLQNQSQDAFTPTPALAARSCWMLRHGERAGVAVGDRTHFIRTGNWASAALRWSVSRRGLPKTALVSYSDDSGDPMASSILLPLARIHSFIHSFICSYDKSLRSPVMGRPYLLQQSSVTWPTFSGRISLQLSKETDTK